MCTNMKVTHHGPSRCIVVSFCFASCHIIRHLQRNLWTLDISGCYEGLLLCVTVWLWSRMFLREEQHINLTDEEGEGVWVSPEGQTFRGFWTDRCEVSHGLVFTRRAHINPGLHTLIPLLLCSKCISRNRLWFCLVEFKISFFPPHFVFFFENCFECAGCSVMTA